MIASVEELSVEAETRDGSCQILLKSDGIYMSLTHYRFLRVSYNLILTCDGIFMILCSARHKLYVLLTYSQPKPMLLQSQFLHH
jgi:hypothetical protein